MGIGFQVTRIKSRKLCLHRIFLKSTGEEEATVKMSRLPVTAKQVYIIVLLGGKMIHIRTCLFQGTTILVEAVPFKSQCVE